MLSAIHLDFHLSGFTPAEAEDMTSLTAEMQREWRKRGYVRKFDKHARFDALDISEMLVLKMFSDRGIGPSRSHAKSRDIAASILYLALELRADAWFASSAVELVDMLPAHATANLRPTGDLGRPLMDFEKQRWLAQQLISAMGFDLGSMGTHVVWWPTDEIQFGSDGRSAISLVPNDVGQSDRVNARFDGPIIYLALEAIAENLVLKAPRPFVAPGIGQAPPGEAAVWIGQAPVVANITRVGADQA